MGRCHLKESIELEQFCDASGGLSFVDLLEDSEFRSILARLPDKSTQGVASFLLEAHLTQKKPILRELSEGRPLERKYPIEMAADGRLLLVGVWHAHFSASGIHPKYRKTIFQIVENNPGQWFVEEGLAAQFGLSDLDYVTELSDMEVITSRLGDNVSGGILKALFGLAKESWQALKNMVCMIRIVDEEVAEMKRN